MIVVGLDTGRESHWFHALSTDKVSLSQGQLPNETGSYQGWAEMLESVDPCIRLVLEAKNGYASPLDQYLVGRGWEVVAVTAGAVKTYREKVMRQHNKTDGTDAEAIARLGLELAPRTTQASQPRLELRRLTRWRVRLVKDLTRERNRLRRCIAAYFPELTVDRMPNLKAGYLLTLFELHPDPRVIAALGVERLAANLREHGCRRVPTRALVDFVALAARNCYESPERGVLVQEAALLARRIKGLERDIADIDALIEQSGGEEPGVADLAARTGVSTVQSASVLSEVQDILNFASDDKLASYAGLALKRDQTGRTRNRLHPQMVANRYLKRHLLSMAHTRLMHDARSKAYYKRKIREGKTHLQALRALARHLIRLVYYVLKRRALS